MMKHLTPFLMATAILASPASTLADDISATEAMQLRSTGTIKSDTDLQAIAMALHPGSVILETEMEREFNRIEYKIELRDPQGQQWDVEMDASTGEVYEDEQDD